MSFYPIDVKNASTAQLVAFYNEHNPSKPVKKFSDRKTAERRVEALIASLNALADAPQVEPEVPAPLTAAQQVIANEQAAAAKVVHKARAVKKPEEVDTDSMSDEEFEAYVKGNLNEPEAAPAGNPNRRSNSAGIAASWAKGDVYAARLTRNGVTVDGHGEFKSVRVAFAALNLPDSKHIRFRMKLKEAKVAVFEWAGKSYTFRIV